MAMTNAMIILLKSVELMEQGVIKGTGQFREAEINGEIRKFEIPEEIHTYAKWKQMGYQVIKGQKSNIKFQVWKYQSGQQVEDTDDNQNEATGGRCYLRTASFFTRSQVKEAK